MKEAEYIFEFVKSWKPVPSWRKRRDDGDFVLLSDENMDIHYLNSTAKDIIELMDGKTIAEICEVMGKIYDVEQVVIQRDVLNVVRELQWNHLIQIRN